LKGLLSLLYVNGLIVLPFAQPDYGRALSLRTMPGACTELPRYLLASKVAALLHHIPDWAQHALVNTLLNTVGRLDEVLALRCQDSG
jgi:hypothetical protein